MSTVPSLVSACLLKHLPEETLDWPFKDGKGYFGKDRRGKKVPFLERLFLILAFPNLELPGQPSRTLGEAIRWKQDDQLAPFGLPTGTAAFEILDVDLFEAYVYPQYKTGSFNKTLREYGLYSTTSAKQAARDRDRLLGAQTKKLSRECICIPHWHSKLRQLQANATAEDVYRHAAEVARKRASSRPVNYTSARGSRPRPQKPGAPKKSIVKKH
jgi:hypothetical protein